MVWAAALEGERAARMWAWRAAGSPLWGRESTGPVLACGLPACLVGGHGWLLSQDQGQACNPHPQTVTGNGLAKEATDVDVDRPEGEAHSCSPLPQNSIYGGGGGVEGGSQEKKMVSELLPREKCLDLPGSSPQGS